MIRSYRVSKEPVGFNWICGGSTLVPFVQSGCFGDGGEKQDIFFRGQKMNKIGCRTIAAGNKTLKHVKYCFLLLAFLPLTVLR